MILIGALFLARNLHPEWLTFDMIARYWPFLLVAWGLLRLVEVVVWHFSSKGLARAGISGGEWSLIILICLLGSAIYAFSGRTFFLPSGVAFRDGAEVFGQAYTFPVSEQRHSASATEIVIDNQRGNTRIVGADTQEIKVSGRKIVRAYGKADAERFSARTPVEVLPQASRIVVRARQDSTSGERRVSSDLEITVPRGSNIRASGAYGDFDITNVQGEVNIDSNNASVRMQDIGGKIRVDARRSDIVRVINARGAIEILGSGTDIELENLAETVNINGYYSGDIQCRNLAKPLVFQSGTTELRLERLSGRLEMDLGKMLVNGVTGPLRLTARSKDVHVEDLGGELLANVERGDVTLVAKQAPTGKIDISTRNGDVSLTLPASARFALAAATDRGEATNTYGEVLRVATSGAGASVKGSTGAGPQITVHTNRGRISVGRPEASR
jgi:hypothetical protein